MVAFGPKCGGSNASIWPDCAIPLLDVETAGYRSAR
jgi:hypothetical protein